MSARADEPLTGAVPANAIDGSDPFAGWTLPGDALDRPGETAPATPGEDLTRAVPNAGDEVEDLFASWATPAPPAVSSADIDPDAPLPESPTQEIDHEALREWAASLAARTGDAAAGSRAVPLLATLQWAKPYLDDPRITEIVVNRPGELFFEAGSEWHRRDAPMADAARLTVLGRAVAARSSNDISHARPVLSAVLPFGERVQIVVPPAVEPGTFSMTIRKPSSTFISFDQYLEQGYFDELRAPRPLGPAAREALPKIDVELHDLLAEGRPDSVVEFLRGAVRAQKVIVVAGETGSGKTTLMKTLLLEIEDDARVVTIEDVRELQMPHENVVHLLYRPDDPEGLPTSLTAASSLRSCLRMKPDRIILGELRGRETYDFINISMTGHAGSITSCHAGSTSLAFERLASMVRQNPMAATMLERDIHRQLQLVVDVVVHATRRGKKRYVSEIFFDPARKLRLHDEAPDHALEGGSP